MALQHLDDEDPLLHFLHFWGGCFGFKIAWFRSPAELLMLIDFRVEVMNSGRFCMSCSADYGGSSWLNADASSSMVFCSVGFKFFKLFKWIINKLWNDLLRGLN